MLQRWFNRIRGAGNDSRLLAAPAALKGTVYYTHGDHLYTPAEYRANFNYTISRALGGQASLDDYTLARAYGVSATAYACTEYNANMTSTLPLVVRDPGQEPLSSTPINYFLSQAPRLMALIARSLDIWGRAYLWKRPNPYGWKTGLEWLNPQRVRELNTVHMRVLGYEIRDEWGYLQEACAPVDDVIVIQAFDTDPTGVGHSRFESAWLYLGIEFGLAQHAAAFFTNAARIDGMLTFDRKLSTEEEDKVIAQWQEFKGAKNAHSTAVMPGGATWTPVQSTPKDLLMSEQDETDEKNIVKIWSMHRALLGSADVADPLSANSTYSGYEINFIRNSVLPRTENITLAALNEQWAWRDFDRSDYYSLAVDEQAIPQLAEAQLAKSETSINLSSSGTIDLDEARQMVGYPARDDGDFLVRNPTLPRIALESGAITLAEYRQMVTGRGGDDANADVIMLGGQFIPARRLMEVASANADRMLNPVTTPIPANGDGFDDPPPGDTAPQLPPPPAQPPDEARAGSSVCIAFDLANDPGLVTLQRRVQELCAGQQVAWNPPERFHVTLLVAPLVEDAQVDALVEALADLDVPDLELRVGSLNCFDNVGEYPLHFRFRRNQALYDFQQEIYDLVNGMGLQVSGHHLPGNFTPHATMGTCAEKPKPVTYRGKVTVHAARMVVWKEDETIYDSAAGAAAAEADNAEAPEPEDEEPPVRNLAPLQVVVDLADNQFVKYARRTLSEALTAQNVLDAEWVKPVDWRLVLAESPVWTPNDVATFLQAADLSDVRKLDIPTNGWHVEGDTVYLTLYPSDALDALRASLALRLEAANLAPSPNWVKGIAVARLTAPELVQLESLPAAQYPLIGANVVVLRGDAIQHRWELRGVSAAALDEVKRWRNMVKRKGRDYGFENRALPPQVEQYIRFALEDDDESGEIFDAAVAMLNRSYRDTRAGYVQAVTSILLKALGDEGSRRRLATDMRTAARRFGLQAAADALEDAGVDNESLSEDDATIFRAWLAETSGYVTNLGEEVFKEPGGLTEAGVATRAQMWADKSLDDLYYALLRQNAPTKQGTWRTDPAKEHCRDEGGKPGCAERNGQVLTLDEWGKRGFPRDRRLACGGWQCGCEILDEGGKVLRTW